MNKERWYLSTIDPNAEHLAKQYGLGLELSEFCTACNLDEHFPETDSLVRKKKAMTDRCVLHGPFNELFPCAVDPKARALARDRYRQTIAAAQGYGISKIVLHAGFNPYLYYPCWFEEQSVAFWQDFVEEIPDTMTVCLENVLEKTPEMLCNILRAVHSPKLRLCLDVGHVNAYSEIPVRRWLEACAPEISHFHLHNNHGERDSHSALFDGTIAMAALLETALRLCKDATFTLELPEAESSVRRLFDENLLP